MAGEGHRTASSSSLGPKIWGDMAMLSLRTAAQALFITTSLLALIQCPHSKVEESFNLQATHDLYYLGLPPSNDTSTQLYDHLKYPGVVPRTFTGPILLSNACRIVGFLLSPFLTLADDPLAVQFLARLLLLLANWHAWFRLASALDKRCSNNNSSIGSYLLMVSACQFHLPFYASRMLPNTFALVIVLHAYSEWMIGNVGRAAACLVAATTVFRCDILLLLFTVGLSLLIRGELSILQAIKVGVLAGLFSLLVTVPLDSHLWQQWTWPEGQVFYYNVILGKSSDWGTSPWYWYLSSAIPKAMLLTLFLVLLCVVRIPSLTLDTTWLPFLLPAAGFVALYSCLGHKEMRFLFPIMPILNLATAVGMTRLEQWAFPPKGKSSSLVAKLAFLGGMGSLVATLLGNMIFLQVSKHNYPGGDALELLTRRLEASNSSDSAQVWIGVASAMSGVSLFGQRDAQYRTGVKVWDKGGYEEENSVRDWNEYTHLLSEDNNITGFHVVDVAQGHPRIDKRSASIVTTEAIYVLARDDYEATR